MPLNRRSQTLSHLQAVLALEDGELFSGVGFGAPGIATGEVVFNTAMSGYQEIITDPSYAGQLVTLTAAHIGNTGVNPDDQESDRMHCAGLIVRDYPRYASSWRATDSLDAFLKAHQRPGIFDLDTRSLTQHLREHGACNGCLMVGEQIDPNQAIEQAKACPSMAGLDLAKAVGTAAPFEWTEGVVNLAAEWQPGEGPAEPAGGRPHVVCVDFGTKRNILRLLVESGCRVSVVPGQFGFDEIMALKPQGVLLSNGPGDPGPCGYAIELVGELLAHDVPTFGICLGHQLLALGAGAQTVKMKLGHHGANHPVKDLDTGEVFITSQNHGFAVDGSGLPEHVVVTHQSLFDGSIQGIRIKGKRAMGFQGHPEASPGPHDLYPLFKTFMRWVSADHA